MNDIQRAESLNANAYTEPHGLRAPRAQPVAAARQAEMSRFILPCDERRTQQQPDLALLGFCQTTYAAAADLGKRDQAALEAGASGPPRAPAEPATRKD
jgi:hypothetical protein